MAELKSAPNENEISRDRLAELKTLPANIKPSSPT